MERLTTMARPGEMTYHEAVEGFRVLLLTRALAEHGGNRTRAAHALGLQRTYFAKLIRDHAVPRDPPRYGRGAQPRQALNGPSIR